MEQTGRSPLCGANTLWDNARHMCHVSPVRVIGRHACAEAQGYRDPL